jgi:GlpG protein
MRETLLQLTADASYRKYLPWVTILCGLACVILFIGINLEPKQDTWEVFHKWGSPSAGDIWNGDYWGLVTSNFLHLEIWHIAFNLYWFWFLGKKIEFETAKAFFFPLLLSAALVSSLSQLAFSGTTGIGLSGIVYAFFGYILSKSKTDEAFRGFINQKTINWFFLWLLLCILLTYTKVWEVGNAAHLGGLLWGLLLGYLAKFRKAVQLGLAFGLLLVFSATLFYQPWSTTWLQHKAYNLLKEQRLDEGEVVCNAILAKDKDNEFAKANLREIRINRLCKKAYDAHAERRYADALRMYQEVLQLEPENAWAKENLALLPVATFSFEKNTK